MLQAHLSQSNTNSVSWSELDIYKEAWPQETFQYVIPQCNAAFELKLYMPAESVSHVKGFC